MNTKARFNFGFTLLELMITVAIIGILATIAYPSYLGVVQKSRRSDAMTALVDIQLQQEKWRANSTTYTADLKNLGYAVATNADSPEGYYTLNISNATGTSYTATATPKTGTPQAGDTCTFTLTQSGPDIGSATKKACWNK